jgi:hypothetical protein
MHSRPGLPDDRVRAWEIGLIATALLAGAAMAASGSEFTVARDGDDAGPGSRDQPFATLEGARAAVRRLIQAGPLPPGGVTVRMRGGIWVRERGFTLEAADSGTAAAPVIYRACNGERPILVSGRAVAPGAFAPADDAKVLARLPEPAHGKVVRLDLRALGIAHVGPPPDLFQGGGGLVRLFVDGRPLPLSRWPKDGYTTMERVLDDGGGRDQHGGTFVYRGDRPARWLAALDGGLWVSGFWRVPWVVQAVRVRAIDVERHAIVQAVPVPGGIGSKYSEVVDGMRRGDGKEPWYACNLLEELGAPGEWCIDFPSRTLYLWPPGDLAASQVLLADSDEPVIRLRGAAHVVLRGLTVMGGLGDGIRIDGGEGDVVAGCLLRDTGAAGVRIAGGRRHAVRSCDCSEVGAQGIVVESGERATLTRGECVVENCHIHHYGRLDPMVSAIEVSGVGNRVASNLIHDGPYGGVLYHGNDQLMELNEVHHIGLDGGDLGAFYSNGDWASRGNAMRANLVHHAPNANAFYMDDGHCGDEIVGNLVYRAGCGPFIGGGHDHRVHGNVVVACPKAFHIDDRGVSRHYDRTSHGLMAPLAALPWQAPPWSTRYPELAAMFAEDLLTLPTGNRVTGNAFLDCARIDLGAKPDHLRQAQIGDNLVDAASPFPGAAQLDFRIAAPDTWSSRFPGIAPIPIERIGLFIDEDRPALPTAAETGRLEDRAPRRIFDSDVDVERSNRH